jgi:hypothetical protein
MEIIEEALEELYKATDMSCSCTPPLETTPGLHTEKHISRAVTLLEAKMSPVWRCDTCQRPIGGGEIAYRIVKARAVDRAKRFIDAFSSEIGELALCPRCYNNNWIIGQRDEI